MHVHAASTWTRNFGELPTTDRMAEAGTVKMAEEIGRLFEQTELPTTRALVMGGHRDGLMSFGANVDEAASRIMEVCREI